VSARVASPAGAGELSPTARAWFNQWLQFKPHDRESARLYVRRLLQRGRAGDPDALAAGLAIRRQEQPAGFRSIAGEVLYRAVTTCRESCEVCGDLLPPYTRCYCAGIGGGHVVVCRGCADGLRQ